MKGLKKLFILAVVFAMTFMSLQIQVFAKAKKTTKEDAKAGVVQINTVFSDANGAKHVLCGGAGILIGDPEKTEYVITCNHMINPADEYKYAGFEFYQIPNEDDAWSKISLSAEVVVEGDVVINASLVTSSPELDLAVLQLAQPIYTRKPLTLLTGKSTDPDKLPYKVVDSVYALGYPDGINFDSGVQYFSNEQIVMTEGSIANLLSINNVQMVEHDAGVNTNNCGGPLVNEYGYVVGMNLLQKDGMYNCALDSTKIAKVIDGLGLEYDKVYENPKDEEEKLPEVVQKPVIPLPFLIGAIVGGVLLLSTIVALVIVLVTHREKSDKKSKKELRLEEEAVLQKFVDRSKVNNDVRKPENLNITVDTMVLGGAGGETSILGTPATTTGQINNGKLIRNKTGEKIQINKMYFSIGKDSLHVDYSIKDNGTISRQHAAIRRTKDGVYLEDCNSTNGTWLNNEKLDKGSRKKLSNGDMIKISNEEFKYEI